MHNSEARKKEAKRLSLLPEKLEQKGKEAIGLSVISFF